MANLPLTRRQMEAVGKAVNRQTSTLYRWRKDSPELFQAVREYAARLGIKPSEEDAYRAGLDATGLEISDCPSIVTGLSRAEDAVLENAWIEGRADAMASVPE